MAYVPCIIRGSDGLPVVGFRPVPQLQPCRQDNAEFWTAVQHVSLLVGITVGLVSLFKG